MRAYACVYRHPTPTPGERRLTELESNDSPLLARYLECYKQTDCFYDRGDDPSFFAATEILGNPKPFLADAHHGATAVSAIRQIRARDHRR